MTALGRFDDKAVIMVMGVNHPVKRVLWQKEVEYLSCRRRFYAFATAYEPSLVSPPEPEIQVKYQHCLVSPVSPPQPELLE